MQDYVLEIMKQISTIMWNWPVIILLIGTGIYFTFALRFMPQKKMSESLRLLLGKDNKKEDRSEGTISGFKSLAIALSGTVGTGNIAGVATAIYFGGPGAIFWMWVVAFFGMATKYSEVLLAVYCRVKDSDGIYRGGTTYYAEQLLHPKIGKILAVIFGLSAALAAFGSGNALQASSIADTAEQFNISREATGLFLVILVSIVIIGGIKIIADFAVALMPTMAILYCGAALIIIIININLLPGILWLILSDAFTGTAATGGFIGAALIETVRYGVSRGLFSNEAGMGTAPMAHASAKTTSPMRQAKIAMISPFLDTIIICSMTAFVILISGEWIKGDLSGVPLSATAFESGLPYIGSTLVSVCLFFFALTTIIGWYIYGETACAYVFGIKSIIPYKIVYILVIYFGSLWQLELVWAFTEITGCIMIIINIVCLLLLRNRVLDITNGKVKGFYSSHKS